MTRGKKTGSSRGAKAKGAAAKGAKAKARNDTAGNPAEAARADAPEGILIVHGVGSQKEGSTVRLVASRVSAAIGEVGADVRSSDVPAAGGPRTTELFVGNATRPVVLAEAHWAPIIAAGRGYSPRELLRRLRFVLLALILVLPLLLLPGRSELVRTSRRDAEARRTPQKKKPWALRVLDDELRIGREMGPTAWRIGSAYALVFGVVWFTQMLPAPWGAIALAAVLIAGVVLAWTRWDLTEHVRVASMDDAAAERILVVIRESLAALESRCSRIRIVAHSQGGYLVHRLLVEDGRGAHPQVVEMIGIGSGIRPIRLLSVVRQPRWVITALCTLVGSLLFVVGVVYGFEPGQVFNLPSSARLMQLAMILVASTAMIDVDGLLAEFSAVSDGLLSDFFGFGWWLSGTMLLAGVITMIVTLLLQHRWRVEVPVVPPLPDRSMSWSEVATPQDIVGRMSIPELPATVVCTDVPGVGHPVFDHLLGSYLGDRSTLRLTLAERVLRAGGDARRAQRLSRRTPLLRDAMLQDGRAVYRLRGLLFAVVVAILVLIPTALGAGLVEQVLTVYGGVAGILVLAWVISALWWRGATRRRLRAFRRLVLGEDDAEDAAIRRQIWRRRGLPWWLLTAAALTAINGIGAMLLIPASRGFGGVSLMSALVGSIAACLAFSGFKVPLVAPILMLTFSLIGLAQLGEIAGWTGVPLFLMPGVPVAGMALILTICGLVGVLRQQRIVAPPR